MLNAHLLSMLSLDPCQETVYFDSRNKITDHTFILKCIHSVYIYNRDSNFDKVMLIDISIRNVIVRIQMTPKLLRLFQIALFIRSLI